MPGSFLKFNFITVYVIVGRGGTHAIFYGGDEITGVGVLFLPLNGFTVLNSDQSSGLYMYCPTSSTFIG